MAKLPIGQLLRELRKESGLSQQAAAPSLGVRPAQLSAYERSTQLPPEEIVEKAIAAYDAESRRDEVLESRAESVTSFKVRLDSLGEEGQRLFHLLEQLRRRRKLDVAVRRLARLIAFDQLDPDAFAKEYKP